MDCQHRQRASRWATIIVAKLSQFNRMGPILANGPSLGSQRTTPSIGLLDNNMLPSMEEWDNRTAALVFVVVAISLLAIVPVGEVSAVQTGTNGTVNETNLTAGANIDDQTIAPTENVSIDRVTLPQNGYVVLHGPSFNPENVTSDSIIGRTQYVRSGSFANVTLGINESRIEGVNISSPGPVAITIFVVPHNDTDGDGDFDRSGNGSFDAPFTNESGGVAFDSANIIISQTGISLKSGTPLERGYENRTENSADTGTTTISETDQAPEENRTTNTSTREVVGTTTVPTPNTGNSSDVIGHILGISIGRTISHVLLAFSVILLLVLGTLTARQF